MSLATPAQTPVAHHPALARFSPWSGEVPAGFQANFLGVLTRSSFFSMMGEPKPQRLEQPNLPPFDEEYFEWIDLLESVLSARRRFAMLELGAGWGRWMVAAAFALRHANPMPHTLVGVELEPTHYEWMKTHFRDNGLDPREATLVHGAVAGRPGRTWAYVGRPSEWYGQAIANTPPRIPALLRWIRGRARVGEYDARRVRSVTLPELLRPLDEVDLIDLDVQGAEYDVLRPASALLDRRVRRVHVGTHGHDIESNLRKLFGSLGWARRNDYACQGKADTPYGRVSFQDGVQTWLNPRFADRLPGF